MMQFQWQVYRALELIPDTVPLPVAEQARRLPLPSGNAMVNSLLSELSSEQQIQFLQVCWQLEIAPFSPELRTAPSRPTPKLVALLKLIWQVSTRDPELETWHRKNSYGQAWSWMS